MFRAPPSCANVCSVHSKNELNKILHAYFIIFIHDLDTLCPNYVINPSSFRISESYSADGVGAERIQAERTEVEWVGAEHLGTERIGVGRTGAKRIKAESV